MTELLDMEQTENQNLVVWLDMLSMRRRLLAETGLCYVETRAFPYTIDYEEEPEDDRMQFWQRRANMDPHPDTHIEKHFRIPLFFSSRTML